MAKLSAKELSAHYGWALATLNSNKQLKSLFQRAVKKQYTPERFIAEMRNTAWFKRQSEAQRKFLVLRTADPAQYVSQVKALMASLADQYSSSTGQVMDFRPPTIKNGKVVGGGGFLYRTAVASLQLGLNESQIKDLMYKSVDWEKRIANDTLGGTLSGQLQELRRQAAMLGIKPSDSWYAAQIDKIADGNDTIDGALARAKNLAMERYPAFADRIESGESVAEIAEGYRESMSRILEINPGELDVFDSKIQGALTSTNEQGAPAAKTLTQFERELRQDSRWQYTKNAKETLLGAGQDLLKSFGLVA